MRLPPSLIAFLKFGSLSGLGWVTDTAILLGLIHFAGLPPFLANLISSSIVALAIFLLSREMIFNKAAGRTERRATFYLLYSIVLICIASFGVQLIAAWAGELAASRHWALSNTQLTAIAKVFVTPPQLILNFLVSRFFSEREMAHG